VAISPDGRLLATGAGDGAVRLFRLPGGEPAGVLRGHDGFVWSVRFSPDGDSLAVALFDGTVRVLEAAVP
jgi:WD40 repeat protein